jgi:hypothetical protein
MKGMFNETNKKTLNMKFIRTGDYKYKTEKITQEELDNARERVNPKNFMTLGRSCWECNGGHIHHLEWGGEYNCFACGRYYMDNIDVTDYSGTEYEKDAKKNILKK